jgi:nucleoside-diphosphate-sugar epimerase
MNKPTILITGVHGEIGHGLIEHFSNNQDYQIVALDLKKRSEREASLKATFIQGDILDEALLAELDAKYDIHLIFHLAAILSTGGEKNPANTHHVNVQGSFNLLNLAKSQSEKRGIPTKFIFPSTIAAYGIPTVEQKNEAGKLCEHQFLDPTTMYGMNKLYVEHLGRYFDGHFKSFDKSEGNTKIDFRCVRLPGIVSAMTVPSGGTSDYGPEMLHAAAKGESYNCFVNPGSSLPFMTMPDAIRALTKLAEAPKSSLTRRIYNVTSFSLTAEQFRQEVLKYFPTADIGYEAEPTRLAIVESWPADVNDNAARKDWNWSPEFDKDRAFAEYLVPGVKALYSCEDITQKKCANG